LKDWKGYKRVIDVSECRVYSPEGKKLGLKQLAMQELGKCIQENWHSSVEDAKVAMELFLKYKYQILKENLIIRK
jgi:hypothetical protein